MALFLIMLASVGCSPQPAELFDTPLTEVARAEPAIVDVGVVFAQRGGQFVFPAKDFGLFDSNEILSIKTSCECVHARPVLFVTSGNQNSSAVEIVVEPENAPVRAPQRLRVQLQFTMAGGDVHVASVSFLNTNPTLNQETES